MDVLYMMCKCMRVRMCPQCIELGSVGLLSSNNCADQSSLWNKPEDPTCEITIYAVAFGIVATYFWESIIARKVFPRTSRSKQVDYIWQYSCRNSNMENASFDCGWMQSASNFWIV